jgi:hypothetical protein
MKLASKRNYAKGSYRRKYFVYFLRGKPCKQYFAIHITREHC